MAMRLGDSFREEQGAFGAQMDSFIWQPVLLFVGAYLLGSIPTAYLVGRLLLGGDIREYGTGNVGATNLWHGGARFALVPVGLFDIAKAALPTWVTLGPLGRGYGAAVTTGLCAAIGHAWSICLGFAGGRGISTTLGMLLVVFPAGVLVQLSFVALGVLLRT